MAGGWVLSVRSVGREMQFVAKRTLLGRPCAGRDDAFVLKIRSLERVSGPALGHRHHNRHRIKISATMAQIARIAIGPAHVRGFDRLAASARNSPISSDGIRRIASRIPGGTMMRSSKRSLSSLFSVGGRDESAP